MDQRTSVLEEPVLAEALRLAGELMACLAEAAEEGVIPSPLLALVDDPSSPPRWIMPRVEGDAFQQILAGRFVLADAIAGVHSWAFAYARDLEDSGIAVVIELGQTGELPVMSFTQRFALVDGLGLSLIGGFDLVGGEFLPPLVRNSLEALPWRSRLAEGAARRLGKPWPAWPVIQDRDRAPLELGELTLSLPESWFFRQTDDGCGWLIAKLLPWDRREFEPSIQARLLTYAESATCESTVAGMAEHLRGEGDEVQPARFFEVPGFSADAGRLSAHGDREGRFFGSDWIWVPTETPGRFLVLTAAWFDPESGGDVAQALEAVLGSIGRAEKAAAPAADPGERAAEPSQVNGSSSSGGWVRKSLARVFGGKR